MGIRTREKFQLHYMGDSLVQKNDLGVSFINSEELNVMRTILFYFGWLLT